ncbi:MULTISPECIES: hypothetical protein [unclassified Flavobacterium]|uniref:hypothetical protein n=1 Tax=unclassified Flavobacterium TaxID=196869 RepID=UPI003F93E37D
MFLIVAKYLIPKSFKGFTIYPFVFLKYKVDKVNPVLINHERIHLRQQLELLIIPFFIWYFVEFSLRYFQYRSFDLAYLNISFEREAYANEKYMDYLKHRSFFSFFKYLNLKKL